MKLAGLSLNQAPPISVPFRFFLTAPCLGIISALIWLWVGEMTLLSRWSSGLLALTHGLVLGVFASVMFGALQQMLPVLAGVTIPNPRRLAGRVWALWVPGVLVLQAAFLTGKPLFFMAAALLLATAILYLALSCIFALRDTPSRNESTPGIRLAIVSLLLTVVLGVLLALGHAGLVPLWRPLITDLHLALGLLGWIALLVLSVAWQVVPMFQITPLYPQWMSRHLARGIFAALLLLVLLTLGQFYWPGHIFLIGSRYLLEAGIAVMLVLFAVHTLGLQRQRRRKIKDSHVLFWRVACINLLLALLLWGAGRLLLSGEWESRLVLLAATVFVVGFVMAVMSGMLYKIVAFLVWFHLQGIGNELRMAGKIAPPVPHMKEVIAETKIWRQLQLLIVAELLLIGALCWTTPATSAVAAVSWLAYFSLMLATLIGAVSVYRRGL